MAGVSENRRMGQSHIANIKKANLIKEHMLRIHNEIRAEGKYPTLRNILRSMPFHVGQTLGTELRRELIEEGLIPPPPRGITKSSREHEAEAIRSVPSPKEIEERKLKIKEEHFALMKDDDDDEDLSPMSPQKASEWARKRYKTAWQSVQAISRHSRRWAFLAHPETVCAD